MGQPRKPTPRVSDDRTHPAPLLLVKGGGFSAQNELATPGLFDALPKYVYAEERVAKDAAPINRTLILRRRDARGCLEELRVEVLLIPAIIKSKEGVADPIFPGAREEQIERVIRQFAVEQVFRSGGHTVQGAGAQIIRVTFTLGQLRRELTSQGHDYTFADLQEALEVLSRATISLSYSRDHARHGLVSAVFSHLFYTDEDGDGDGERTWVAVDYHPLASDAIVHLALMTEPAPSYDESTPLPRPLGRPRRRGA